MHFTTSTTGDNFVPCTSGTPTTGPVASRCPTAAPFQIGFSAGTGYDLVTGLGSIDANKLVTSWPGFVVTPDFSVGATSVVTYCLSGADRHVNRHGEFDERV